MPLSRLERRLLINQLEILSHLDKKNAAEHEKMIEALRWGYTNYYDPLLSNMSEEISEEDQSFVLHSMSLYDAMQRVGQADPSLQDLDLRFHGFDGNNETELMGYARFVVGKEGRFASLDTGRDLNSHMPMSAHYRAQLSRWRIMGSSYNLDAAQVRDLMLVRNH